MWHEPNVTRTQVGGQTEQLTELVVQRDVCKQHARRERPLWSGRKGSLRP